MKIKVFTVSHKDKMEEVVNEWLAENPTAAIHHVHQSESMNAESWSLSVTIFYTPPEKGSIGFASA